jgi:hypothetical protein
MSRAASLSLLSLTSIALAACGDNIDPIESESVYAGRCASPRTGIDPFTGRDFVDVQGSVLTEQLWVRSWTDNLYLWYREVPDADPTQFATVLDYFDVMKTGVFTASGKPKDQFHFTYETSDWVALSQSGVEASYGLQWALLSSTPPRKLVVAYVEPGTPAAIAPALLDRGAEVTSIDGVDVANGSDVDTLNSGLAPAANETHTFVVLDRGSTTPRTVTLTSAKLASVPVRNIALAAPNDKVGYLLFNDHIATAEKGLVSAFTQLRNAAVEDLIIDIRYNGGGYLDIAGQLAYMVAGPTATAGKTFEREMFNDKHPTVDPVLDQPLMPTPFHDETLGFSLAPGQQLPFLGLRRVFVLTGSGTCSASEAVMNGLAGVDVEVIQIGTTTCGKPYGFYPTENCGTTFFSIQFQGVNEKGFGDYSDGFVPGGVLHGCTVADDFTHGLGDPAEARLAAALAYRANQTCPPSLALGTRGAVDPLSAVEGELVKSAWRQNRIMTR